MALVIPPEFKNTLPQIFNRLGGSFEQWLQMELSDTLLKLADAHDDVVMRQMQGRSRFIRELIEQIHAAQR